jgi:small-conductance mechanosensitive channel
MTFIISILQIWRYSDSGWSWFLQTIQNGFDVGTVRIAPVQIILGIILFSVLLTLVRWFRQNTLPKWVRNTNLDRGGREAMITISGYIGVLLSALLGLSVAGFDFTNLAIIAGALSVGIGFGLQNIVNNFVSGLILLFERPIRTGDWIIVGNTEGYVRKISIRSTQIETFDRADVIVPNSELISNQVTNWMLHDAWGRVIVPVGVAYGSDVRKVEQILINCGMEHPLVLKDNDDVGPPRVIFRGFGDSSLNFELRAFINVVDKRLSTLSELNFAIEKALRENGIEIPFPQRDLHLRSVDSSIVLTSKKSDSDVESSSD